MSCLFLSARPESDSEHRGPPEGGKEATRQRRGAEGRRREDDEREQERAAESVTPRPERGGGRAFGAKGAGDQRQTAAERPSRSARTPADGGPAGGGSGAPTHRGDAQPARPSADLAKPGVQPGAESGSGGLGGPRAVRVFEDKHAA
jgi:hypothetical protein